MYVSSYSTNFLISYISFIEMGLGNFSANLEPQEPLGTQELCFTSRAPLLKKKIKMAAPRVAFAGQTIPAYAKTVGRAVHIKIYPRPRNLAESREVLRVLQQYGEIVSYRLLKVCHPMPLTHRIQC